MRRELRDLLVFTLVLVSFVTSGCTRSEKKEKTAGVKVQLPMRMGTQSKTDVRKRSGMLTHAVLNVRGGDFPVKLCTWDQNEGGRVRQSGQCGFVQRATDAGGDVLEFSVTVPPGSGRMVQVLLAYDASTASAEHAMDIYYGGVPGLNFASGDVPVNVAVSKLNAIASNPAMIRGRYLTSPSAGPSGLMEVKVKGHPEHEPMTLMMGEMLSGWFESIAFETIPVEIFVGDMKLFGKPMLISDFDALLGANVYKEETASETKYVGFFGDATATTGKSACALNCTGQEFVDYLKPRSYWRGPFTSNMNMDANGLSWTLLPGIAAAIDSLRVFKITNVEPAFLDQLVLNHGVYDCEFLRTTLGEGMTVDKAAAGLTMAQIGGLDPNTDMLAVCPVRGARLLTNAFVIPEPNKGSSNRPYFRVEISGAAQSQTAQDTYELITDHCFQASITAYTYDGVNSNPFTNSTAATWDLDLLADGTPWANFFSDPNCMVPADGTEFDVSVGQSSSSQFYMSVDSTVVTSGYEYAFAIPSLPAEVDYQPLYNTAIAVLPRYQISGPATAGNGVCHPYTVTIQTPSGSPITADTSTMIDIVDPTTEAAVASYNTFTECLTNGTPGGVFIGSSQSSGSFYYKATGAFSFKAKTNTANMTIEDSPTFNGTVDTQSAAAFSVHVQVDPYNLTWDSCINGTAILKNEAGNEVAANYEFDLPLDVAGQGFGFQLHWPSAGNCGSEMTTPLHFMIGQSRIDFAFKLNGVGPTSTSLSFVSSHPGLSLSGSFTPLYPTTRPFARIQAPSFASNVIGSHEFAPSSTFRQIPIIATAGSTVTLECEDTGRFSNNWTATCSSSVTGNTILNWDMAEAMAGKRLRLLVDLAPYSQEAHVFDPLTVFRDGLTIVPCDYVLAGATANLETTVGNGSLVYASAPFTVVAGKVCMNASAAISNSGTIAFAPSGGLIGWSDRSTSLTNTDVASNIFNAGADSVIVANLNVQWSSAPNGGMHLVASTGLNSATPSIYANLVFDGVSTNPNVNAFYLTNDPPHVDMIWKVDAKLGNDGVFLRNFEGAVEIYDSRLLSAAGAANPAFAFRTYGTAVGATVTAERFAIANLNGTGPGIAVLNDTGYLTADGPQTIVEIVDSHLNIASNSVSLPALKVADNTLFRLTSSKLANETALPAIYLSAKSASLSLRDSIVESRVDQPALKISSAASSFSQSIVEIGGTDFIRTGAAGNTSPAVLVDATSFTGGATVSITQPSGSYIGQSYSNSFCGGGTGPQWSGVLTEVGGSALNTAGAFDPAAASLSTLITSAGRARCR